jgi:hypothetical protein
VRIYTCGGGKYGRNEELQQLIEFFTEGNQVIEAGLEALHSQPTSLPPAFRLSTDQRLREFMGQALQIYRHTHTEEV